MNLYDSVQDTFSSTNVCMIYMSRPARKPTLWMKMYLVQNHINSSKLIHYITLVYTYSYSREKKQQKN